MPCKEAPLHCLWKAKMQCCCQETILTFHDETASLEAGGDVLHVSTFRSPLTSRSSLLPRPNWTSVSFSTLFSPLRPEAVLQEAKSTSAFRAVRQRRAVGARFTI